MRKLLCILMMLCFLCAGCTGAQQPLSSEKPVSSEPSGASDAVHEKESGSSASPSLKDYLTGADLLDAPVREYGESVSHMQMEEDFVARILYPAGDLEALDAAVEGWVLQTAAYYQGESAGSSADGDSAELTVDYSSYLIEDIFVSVKLLGIYDRPYLAHPIDVSASFNASRATGELLRIEDVLLPGGKEALREMVVKDAGVVPEASDENILDHWLLTPDGLEITLVRGEYLPMSSGTVTLVYAYEKLEGILALPASVPEEEPVPDTQQPPPAPKVDESIVDPEKPMLALTFDDGPSAHTERLLDVFAAHGGKGTFYVVGNMLDGRAETLQRMAAEGHEIGGHSWNHRQLTKLSEQQITDQIMKTKAKIYEVTGIESNIVRPPYGSCNKQVKAVGRELGVSFVNWSVDTLDWKYKDAKRVHNVIMEKAKSGAIILCHDIHKTTVDAMETVIPQLIKEGYQLVTVSELMAYSKTPLKPGQMYYKQ